MTTNAALQTCVTSKNDFGENEQVVDNLDNVIAYTYDAYGQLINATLLKPLLPTLAP